MLLIPLKIPYAGCMKIDILFAGISMLQQGPLLSFVDENQLQKLLHGHDLRGSEKQFREGLNRLGFVDVS